MRVACVKETLTKLRMAVEQGAEDGSSWRKVSWDLPRAGTEGNRRSPPREGKWWCVIQATVKASKR